MSNPRTLAALCAGIVKHENGSQPYTDEQIGAGVSAALGLSALHGAKRITGDIAFDSASPAAQAAYISQLQSIQNEQRAQLAQQMDESLKDVYSALGEGFQPNWLPSQSELVTTYGPAKGMRKWQDLKISKVMVALLEQPEACRRQRGRTYLNACGQRIRMYLILQPTSSAGTKCRQNLSSSMPNGRRTGGARDSLPPCKILDPNDKKQSGSS